MFDPATPPPDDWWRLYRDPVLDDLIARAFAANTDLRVATANLARSQAVFQEARSSRLPATNLTGGVSYGNATLGGGGASVASSAPSGQAAEWSQSGALAVSWEVDLFGRVARTIDSARSDADAVEAARDAVRVTVAAETTRTYLKACAAAFALEVARGSYEASQASLRLVTAQERAGSVGKLDVERAGAAAATARAAIPALEEQRQVALFELAALVGATPDKVPEGARACLAPPEPIAVLPVGDGTALLRRRPDLRQAERQLAADTARIGIATADLYPQISLGGAANYFRDNYVRGSDSLTFQTGPLLSWSFPNLTIARSRIRQAEAQGDASLAAFDGRVLTALKEVEQALSTVAAEQRQYDAFREAQDRSQKAYDFANLRYRAGSIGYLDVLVAQADLFAARANYAGSIQRLSSARVDLFKALGGGWQSRVPAEGPQ
jgi:NodT family efflux transporter outer membrane factor (OMF) lipoprotein